MIDETNYLTKEQLDQFLETIPKLPMYHTVGIKKPKLEAHVLQLLFKVIYEGALRVTEAISLTPDSLVLEKRLLKLENTKGIKESKRGRRELGWVKDDTFDALCAHAKGCNGRLFPLTRSRVWQLASQVGDICNIELLHLNKDTTNMTVHTLRHSRAVHLLDGGLKVNELMQKLRHRSLEPTTTYARVSNESVRAKEALL